METTTCVEGRAITAKELFFTLLQDNGVRRLYGNPGTTELELLKGLDSVPDLRYVLALHDAAAVGMAHGDWIARRELVAANLHAAAGIASAMGNIYNAYRSGVPMLITAGQVDQRMQSFEPPLFGDLVSMMRPVTKWAWEVNNAGQMAHATQRAIRIALTPPQGPVFLALPMDVVEEPGVLPSRMALPVAHRPTGFDPALVERVASLLRQAERPLVIVGEALDRASAGADLGRVARLTNARIVNERVPPTMPVSTSDPRYEGTIGFSARQIRERLAAADLIVVVGASRMAPIVFDDEWGYDVSARVVHIADDDSQLGLVLPYDIAVVGAMRPFLTQLGDLLEEEAGAVGESGAGTPGSGAGATTGGVAAGEADPALTAAGVIAGLSGRLSADALVIDEALTTSRAVLAGLDLRPRGYYGINGTSLGWGLPAAVGAQLADPSREVVAVLGDGATLYSIQSLWSAAHYRASVTVLVVNNRGYRILKEGSGPDAAKAVPLDIADPAIDYPSLAAGFGVPARRVGTRTELADALDWAQAPGPHLIEAVVDASA